MQALQVDQLRTYLSSVYRGAIEIKYLGKLGGEKKKPQKELKGFGYGVPYVVDFVARGETRSVVLETIRPGAFGHDHFSDRAQILLWQHSAFNKLPRHARSVDVGAFTTNGALKSAGDFTEFFIVTEKVEGNLYHQDLDRIGEEKTLTELDEQRCQALSDYLVQVHAMKKAAPELYVRRIRDLLGHGEGIMGLIDSYPSGLSYITESELCEIEERCVQWRWRIKGKTHRCSQVHGDFHPWNILFRNGADFSALDRSRGEWGEPADDVSAMSINYIFYALRMHGHLTGPFETLFNLFWENYLDKSGDEEILKAIQPFYAWRALVIASPLWYPNLHLKTRTALFSFVKNVLEAEIFDPAYVNSHFKE